ncbi:MAG: deoxyribodipyrimidine photo-lyase, partial [Limibacillus sp.]
MAPSLLWFRQDLRLTDNPALTAALARREGLVALFILDDETAGEWAWGGASRWWLHHSLAALSKSIEGLGGRLILRKGCAEKILPEVAEEAGAGAAFWNRCYEPFAIARDKAIKSDLKAKGLEVESFNGSLLVEPWELKTGAGEPYKVFTPFWKALSAQYRDQAPLKAPTQITAPETLPRSDRLEDWKLLPDKPDWAGGLREAWTPGEAGAQARLADFLDEALADYKDGRNRPDKPFVSRISPHLHWGELSPRQVWHATRLAAERSGDKRTESSAWSFLREVGWRDFSYNLLFNWPSLPDENWKENFDGFPWAENEAGLRAWQRGRTGYPIVDAGMRE